MRNPKNLDDVLKTDKSSARIDQDTSEAARYGLFSMLAPKKKTEEQKFQEQMSKATPEQRMLINFRHVKIKEKRQTQISPPSWRGNKGQVTWK